MKTTACRTTPFWLVAFTLLAGCGSAPSNWYEKMGWVAEDYFEDPLVVELCKAIEANNLEGIDSLVAEGADVNAIGKGNMTPLLWSFPDDHIERFQKLLEHGADPNVLITDDFNTNQSIPPGYAVTHLVLRSDFKEHYKSVFDHGGDANLQTKERNGQDTPLHVMIDGAALDKSKRLQLLIDSGADTNAIGKYGCPPASNAVAFSQYGLALDLLEAGADPLIYHEDELQTLVHYVVKDSSKSVEKNGKITPYGQLIKWLREHSIDLQSARDDHKRWLSMTGNLVQKKAKKDREILERKKREKESRQ